MTVGMAKEICSEIRGTETDIRQGEGTYIGNPVTGRRIYTPPAGRQVIEEKLRNSEQFMNAATDLDPLVQMAVAHYQFEAIHPFVDGNGRAGRVINGLLFVAKELLREPILYVSQYIIQHKYEYYRLLNPVTESGAWEEWITCMLHAVETIARSTRLKIKAVQHLQEQFAEQLLAGIGPHYPVGLSDILFERPYCRVKDVVDGCGVSRPTAVKYLSALVEAGMLAIQRAGRENLYINTRFMFILRSPDAGL